MGVLWKAITDNLPLAVRAWQQPRPLGQTWNPKFGCKEIHCWRLWQAFTHRIIPGDGGILFPQRGPQHFTNEKSYYPNLRLGQGILYTDKRRARPALRACAPIFDWVYGQKHHKTEVNTSGEIAKSCKSCKEDGIHDRQRCPQHSIESSSEHCNFTTQQATQNPTRDLT